jgi:hypothetical protein
MQKLHEEGTIAKVKAISSKPVLGVPLGAFRIILRYAGQVVFVELEGALSDATTLFTNPDVQAEFKEVIFEEIEFLKTNRQKPSEQTENASNEVYSETELIPAPIQEPEEAPIDQAKNDFESYDFTKACNVLILEEFFTHQKHLILQIGRLSTLTQYASYNDRSQRSFIRGQKVDCIVDGVGLSFAHKKYLLNIGEVYIHIFIPEDHRKNSEIEMEALKSAVVLTDVVPVIPQTIEIKKYLKAKEDMLTAKNDTIDIMGEELTKKSVRLDAAKIAVSAFETETPPTDFTPKKSDFLDACIIGGPTFLFSLIGGQISPFGWFAGMVLGFFVGFAFHSKRR